MLSELRQRLEHPRLKSALDALKERYREPDPWGFDPNAMEAFTTAGSLLYRYFRPEVTGIENVPSGRVLLVPNHSGQLPFDAVIVGMACLVEADPPRMCRGMYERWVPQLPFVNVAFSRMGGVLGDPVNCRNLLEQDAAILVFPEGAKGSGKTWWKRYQLEKFGRGFMRLALQTNTPIVPVSVVGAEESIISIADLGPMAKSLGMPYLPVPLLLPLLGPFSMVPMPTKFHLDFGEPMVFDGPFDDEDDNIDRKVQEVRGRVQQMIDHRLSLRESIF